MPTLRNGPSPRARWHFPSLLSSQSSVLSPILLAAALTFLLAAGPGLDTLSDDPVRIELANDGLSTLLDRAYTQDNVPADRRGTEQAVSALRELSQSNLSDDDRNRRLKEIVAGIGPALPQIDDPQLLLSAASMLVKQGVEQDANILEYFGEQASDSTKARLEPVVATAVAIYQRAVSILDQRQAALQDKITRPGDPIANEWEKDYQAFQIASYTRWMLSYDYALSIDSADKRRAEIADEGIKALAQWDNSDSGVQPLVRLQIAKLTMLKGQPADLYNAKEILTTIDAGALGDVSPAPDRFTRFNAKYFRAVCDIIAGDAKAADADAKIADDFRLAELAGVPGEDYAIDMLQYRIASLKGDDDGAVRILEELSDKAPGLRGPIAVQLLGRLPVNPDLSKLPPLMLSALVERAWSQITLPNPDKTVLAQALEAANRYMAAADQGDPQTTAQTAIDASKIRGLILKAQGHPAEAAAAFLDHAQRYKNDPNAQAGEALSDAIAEIAAINEGKTATTGEDDGAHQADISALEDKVLPLAVESFRRYDLAYEYARRLQRGGQSARAAAIFDLVPADDPNAFDALFFKMVALDQRLEADPHDAINSVSPGDMPQVLAEVQKLADTVTTQAAQRQAAATDPAQKRQYQSLQVRTLLLAADIAGRQGHDPARTIALLNGFEKTIAGLPDERSLLGQALNLRVAAYMSSGDVTKATDSLLQYLNTAGGNEGLQTVYNLLTKLNHDLDHAQAAGDKAKAKELADDRAELTPFLVKWAQTNTNPDINKFTYRYSVFDAATQKQAAEMEQDSAARTTKLKAALARYQELLSPANVQLYQASLPADAPPDVQNYPDPAVTLGIGETAFALGDWKQAHDSIGTLLEDSKLGDGAILTKNAAGQEELADNEQFWQAQYEFIYATAQLARDASSGVDPQTPRTMLARLEAVWQDRTGGAAWRGKFEDLHRMLAAPATQP
ncbi:MAG: hypothetical protein ABSH22_09025 [Tepidisphaeraceae bacterium]